MGFTGFRRRWRIEPGKGAVTAALEDDIHCMAVTLHHDGETILSVEAVMDRWPWHTCPGAEAVVRETFVGTKLAEAARRGEKQANCTHLYDLAVLAAGHAADAAATHYDAWVSDPDEGAVESVLLRGGDELLRWTLRDDVLQSPAELAGSHVMKLRDWIATLEPAAQEGARLLQWATLIAHGPRGCQATATPSSPSANSTRGGSVRCLISVSSAHVCHWRISMGCVFQSKPTTNPNPLRLSLSKPGLLRLGCQCTLVLRHAQHERNSEQRFESH
jgi:Protein of unknown function (DUF2889)